MILSCQLMSVFSQEQLCLNGDNLSTSWMLWVEGKRPLFPSVLRLK